MKEKERFKFEIMNIEKLKFCDDKLVYCIKTNDAEVLLFETKIEYEIAYDISFEKTNMIGGLVEFINQFNDKIVVSNLRFLKRKSN